MAGYHAVSAMVLSYSCVFWYYDHLAGNRELVVCFLLVCNTCTVHRSLFALPPSVTGRLFSVIVLVPEHCPFYSVLPFK